MRSEGSRRLSLFLGILGGISGLIFVTIGSKGFKGFSGVDWLVVIIVAPLFFIVPYGLVKGIAWVVDGFKRDKQKTGDEKKETKGNEKEKKGGVVLFS